MRRLLLLLVSAVLLAGCGDDDPNTTSTGDDITVVQLNKLHGTSGQACRDSANCRLADRMELLFDEIADSGCPDVIALQEVWRGSVPLLMDHAANACPFAYEVRLVNTQTKIDDEMILSRYPILATDQIGLFPGFRHALWVRIDHPLGPLDVFTTHLASSSDGATARCDIPNASCPSECLAAGATTRRECQAVQLALFVEAKHDVDAPALVTGDFNEEPGSFVYEQFSGRGWTDAYLAAGNAECDPASGAGCTSGRDDESLTELESPVLNEDERIDFIFVVPPRAGFRCRLEFDPATDRDGDDTATRIFPPGSPPSCGAAPAPICWPSDHMGVELDLNCN